ncbi:MAG: NUDIX domain-containing protein, partial [Bacteroidota bacterium]|nr:NUDIX domain-containing protein [Bacteroidota bacterium]
YKGMWCLPSGFAESGESIEAAALRELEEEAGIKGKILDLVDANSAYSYLYGDLLFLTFEVEQTGGKMMAGDDASDVKYFPLDKLPELAFVSNMKAVEKFILNKREYWAIMDSFSRSVESKREQQGNDFLSDKLIRIIEDNAEIIANNWLDEVRSNPTTPGYARFDKDSTLIRSGLVISQFGKWLGEHYTNDDIREFYLTLGQNRRKEGFALSEVLSALSLTRKHIWEFALSQKMWSSTIDIYMTLELERRMMLFFDKAAFHISRGYEINK